MRSTTLTAPVTWWSMWRCLGQCHPPLSPFHPQNFLLLAHHEMLTGQGLQLGLSDLILAPSFHDFSSCLIYVRAGAKLFQFSNCWFVSLGIRYLLTLVKGDIRSPLLPASVSVQENIKQTLLFLFKLAEKVTEVESALRTARETLCDKVLRS